MEVLKKGEEKMDRDAEQLGGEGNLPDELSKGNWEEKHGHGSRCKALFSAHQVSGQCF